MLASADTNATLKIYHMMTPVLMGLTPVALMVHPSALSMPVDVALGIVFPIHMHIAMGYVITDYAPKFLGKGGTTPMRFMQIGLSALTVLGLAKLNFAGAGITGTFKALWAAKKE